MLSGNPETKRTRTPSGSQRGVPQSCSHASRKAWTTSLAPMCPPATSFTSTTTRRRPPRTAPRRQPACDWRRALERPLVQVLEDRCDASLAGRQLRNLGKIPAREHIGSLNSDFPFRGQSVRTARLVARWVRARFLPRERLMPVLPAWVAGSKGPFHLTAPHAGPSGGTSPAKPAQPARSDR